jgi:hypothetical protein
MALLVGCDGAGALLGLALFGCDAVRRVAEAGIVWV